MIKISHSVSLSWPSNWP